MKKDVYCALDVGGTKIALALFDKKGNMVIKDKFPSNRDWEPLDFTLELSNKIRTNVLKSNSNLIGIGLAMPSYIDTKTGNIFKTTSIPKIKDCNLIELFKEQFSTVPLVLDNDATVATIAEHRLGAGQEFTDMVYVAFSTGIGGGLILNNKVYRGAHGMAGEIGHIVATPGEGVMCACGNTGCIMGNSSGLNIPKWVKIALDQGKTTSMLEMAGGKIEDIDGKILEDGIKQGDQVAVDIFAQMNNTLGLMCYNLLQTLDIQGFVFGGGLVTLGIDGIEKVCKSYIKGNSFPVKFKIACIGNECGLLGAYLIIKDYMEN